MANNLWVACGLTEGMDAPDFVRDGDWVYERDWEWAFRCEMGKIVPKCAAPDWVESEDDVDEWIGSLC